MSIIVDSAAQPVKLQWKCDQSLHMEAALTQSPLCQVSLVLTSVSGVQKDHTCATAMTTARCYWNAWQEQSSSQPGEAKLMLWLLFLVSPHMSESQT